MARLPIPRDLVINFAGMVFLGSVFFLAWSGQQLAALLSLRGIGFVLIGVIACGTLIGWPLAKLHRLFTHRLLSRNNGEMTESSMQAVRFSGTALMIAQVLGIYLLTEKLFHEWLVPSV